MNEKKLTYKDAGVSVEKGEELARWIRQRISPLNPPEVLSRIGSFSGLYALNKDAYSQPVLAATADGVGTKLKIAQRINRHDTVGIDLVAMCVNDLLCQGAKPLFFLDYLAMGKLSLKVSKQIISGIIEGCRRAQCILLGGETAEMPSFYTEGEYDLVGFAVGVIERKRIINGSKVKVGDKILGIPSSGLHSNGFSLVRKVFFEKNGHLPHNMRDILGRTLEEELLEPTRIYTPQISHLLKKFRIKGIAHITGGGMARNIPRILPEGCKARVYKGRWKIHPIFGLIREKAKMDEDEMFEVFNMGIGMVLIISPEEEELILKDLAEQGEKASRIGDIIKGRRGIEILR